VDLPILFAGALEGALIGAAVGALLGPIMIVIRKNKGD
jgi:uncharacterized membrane protein